MSDREMKKPKPKGGKQAGAANVEKFKAWKEERYLAYDWADYIPEGGKSLDRSKIVDAIQCGRSAIYNNDALKGELAQLETALRAEGILPPLKASKAAQSGAEPALEATGDAVAQRMVADSKRMDAQVKALQERNAALVAENHNLRERVRQFEHIDEHLGLTGRLLPEVPQQ